MELNNSDFCINKLGYINRDREDTNAAFREIVFSSKVRLSRNIPEFPFSHNITRREYNELKSIARAYVSEYSEEDISIVDVEEFSAEERRYLREKNIITPGMEKSSVSFLLLNNCDRYSILVNDGDHFKIQVIRPGLALMDAYRIADEVDEKLNRITTYSFDPSLGYLSPEISNIGTSMKVSVLLHLPTLSFSGRINRIIEETKSEDIRLKGAAVEAGKNRGAIYMLYNSRSLGVSEIDLLEMADVAVNRIIAMEDEERDAMYSSSRVEIEDRIMRSLGILKHALSISYSESISLLSNIRLGVILSLVRGLTLRDMDEIMEGIQPCHLEKFFKRRIDSMRDAGILRSEYLKKVLEQVV